MSNGTMRKDKPHYGAIGKDMEAIEA